MKISTKSRYAVMAMMELAMRGEESSLNLNEISKVQGISISYLEQLFAKLRQCGLVKGRRGPGGGYRLGMSPDEITVSDIIAAVNGGDHATLSSKTLTDDNYPAAVLWDRLSNQLVQYLDGITLAQCTMHSEFRQAQPGPGPVQYRR